MEEELVKLVSQVGFPIVVCLWFMVRTEKVIKNNTDVMNKVLEKF
jgi:hypothetical protein